MMNDHPVVAMHAHRPLAMIAEFAGAASSFDDAYVVWRTYGNKVPQDYADYQAQRRLAAAWHHWSLRLWPDGVAPTMVCGLCADELSEALGCYDAGRIIVAQGGARGYL